MKGLGLRVEGSRVQDFGSQVQGSGLIVQGCGMTWRVDSVSSDSLVGLWLYRDTWDVGLAGGW